MADDKKLSPELRRRLAKFVMDREAARRAHAINHFQNVETMVARVHGLSDDEAEQLFQRMLDDAESDAERGVVSTFVDAIKVARSAKPSS
jgi:hypothetical protein